MSDPYGRPPPDPYGRPYDPYAASGAPPPSSAPPQALDHYQPPPAYPPGAYPPPPGYGAYGPPPAYGHPPAPHAGYPPPAAAGYWPPPAHPGYPPPHGYGHHPGYPPHPQYGYPPPHGYPPHPAYGGYDPHGGAPRGRSRSRSAEKGGSNKHSCAFFIGIANDKEFQVGKRIIGQGGVNMKDILKKAGSEVKLRLRGKGSGYKEHSTNVESEEPLQLCISCTEGRGYDLAIACVDALLRRIYYDYDRYCQENGLPGRAPEIWMKERRESEHRPNRRGGQSDNKGGGKRRDNRQEAKPAIEDRGEQPEGAPAAEEVETLVQERNKARKAGDFKRADQIRDDLHERKVVLSDEKGAAGKASTVTTWRYWHE